MKKNRSERVTKRAERKATKKREPYRPWKKRAFWIGCFLYALTLPLFTNVFGLWSIMNEMGYGTFRYTDQTYLELEQAIDACLTPDYGLDVIKLRRDYNVLDCSNSIVNGKVLIVAMKKDGFFTATVTVELDETYHVKENGVTRNYNSVSTYAQDVKKHLSIYSTLYGIAAWFIVGIIGCIMICIWDFLWKTSNSQENGGNVASETIAELPAGKDEETSNKEKAS